MFLIDTDWVIDWLKGRPPAVQLLSVLQPQGFAIGLVTYGEVYEGIYFGRDPLAAEASFRLFLRGVAVLPLTRPVLRRFAEVRGGLRARGILVGDPDILIAATALHHRLTLVTRNQRDCQRVLGLALY